MLMTDPRRAFGRREADDERDPWQGSLFAPDALAPPAKPPGPTPDPFAPPAPEAVAPPAEDARPLAVGTPAMEPVAPPAAPSSEVVASPPAEALAPPPEVAAPEFAGYDDEPVEYADDPEELEPAHARVAAARRILAGPTLDDVMSRVWEGLRAEVPTPCPVCHAEIEPSAHGHCGSCGSTLA